MTGVMITVYCEDDSHPTKRANLETFTRRHGSGTWSLWPVRPRDDTGKISRWAMTALDRGTQVLDVGPGSDLTEQDLNRLGLRYRFEIECPLCEQPLQVRSEKLYPILDVLADHAKYADDDPNRTGLGVFDISLKALAARVSGK